MENGQEVQKSEEKNDAVVDEVIEKPADDVQKDAEDDAQDDANPKESTEEKTEEPSAELLEKIKKQVEYYFGDVNMQRDRFLTQQIKLDDGWIPMNIMLNFKMLAGMTTDPNVILKALESSDLIEISENRTKIRRSPKHPLPVYDEEYRKMQEAKTVYVKGFPLQGTTIDTAKKFFDNFEPYENIVLRKYQDKNKRLQFKGSVFVQFKTLDDAKAFMARESVQYDEKELIRMWARDYSVMKSKENEERKQKKLGGKSNAEGKDEDKCDNEEDENGTDESLPKGSIIHIANVPETITRENIKEKLGEMQANVAYIDFKKGNTEGWIRLQGENAGKAIIDKMDDGKLTVMKQSIQCRLLEGEEEQKYLAKVKEDITNARRKHTKGKYGRKGRNAQRGRKRKDSPARDGPPTKKAALD